MALFADYYLDVHPPAPREQRDCLKPPLGPGLLGTCSLCGHLALCSPGLPGPAPSLLGAPSTPAPVLLLFLMALMPMNTGWGENAGGGGWASQCLAWCQGATPLVGLAARLTGSGPVDPGTPKARTQPRAEADARLETRTRRERLLPRGWGRSGLRPLLSVGGGAHAWGGRGSGLLSPNSPPRKTSRVLLQRVSRP